MQIHSGQNRHEQRRRRIVPSADRGIIGRCRWLGPLVAGLLCACSEPRDGFSGFQQVAAGNGPSTEAPGGGGSTAFTSVGGSAVGGRPESGGTNPGDEMTPSSGAGGSPQSSSSAAGEGGAAGASSPSGGSVSTASSGGLSSTGGTDHTAGGSAGSVAGQGTCPGLPAVSDYAEKGPFDVKVVPNTGPDGTYYLFRPDSTLGMAGFKHPIAVWGNGILTTPDQYQSLLGHLASHGIVVIACPSTQAERPCLDAGMEWLVKQNDADGPMKGKLDTAKEITIGYSWGGGAAIDTANRPHVKATISIHGMPPRETDAWNAMKSPLLLFTSTGDTFVDAKTYVTPNYESSLVPTFYATLEEDVGHLYPIDENAGSCLASVLLKGPCSGASKERAPIVAWIRLWACADSAAKRYFYGPNCVLCGSPWKSQSKPVSAFQ